MKKKNKFEVVNVDGTDYHIETNGYQWLAFAVFEWLPGGKMRGMTLSDPVSSRAEIDAQLADPNKRSTVKTINPKGV